MKSVQAILADAEAQGARLHLRDDGQVEVRGRSLPKRLVRKLRKMRKEIAEHLEAKEREHTESAKRAAEDREFFLATGRYPKRWVCTSPGRYEFADEEPESGTGEFIPATPEFEYDWSQRIAAARRNQG